MATLQINNVNINVVEMNPTASEAIVMLHGMFTNLSVFYYKIAHQLAEKFHVVLYDLRGHGLSDSAPSGYDFQTMSDDLLELLKVLELEKAHIVGYSYGGLIALYTAMHHPEKAGKIAVIEAPNPTDEEPRKLLENYSKTFLEQYIQGMYVSAYLKPSARQIEKNHKQHDYLFNNTTLIDDITKNRDFFSEIARANILHETLLLYAKNSDCNEAGEFLHRHICNSQLFFGEGDHNLPLQSPDWIVGKLKEFIT